MYQKYFLSLKEARKAVDSILDEACKKEPFFPVSAAVVDMCGDLIYFARLDGSFPVQARMAINKAYTAALIRGSTSKVAQFLRKSSLDSGNYCDSRFTALGGAVCITSKDGTPVAGIGVSGLATPEDDDELVTVGPKALRLPYK